jgi:hypothetical protein
VNRHQGSVASLVHRCFALVLAVSLLMLPGCGSGSSSSSDSTPSSGSTLSSSSLRSPYTAITGPNVQPMKVSSAFAFGYISVLFILDSLTLGIPTCATNTAAGGEYCPTSTVSYTVTTLGFNGVSGTVSFSIANANTLASSNNWAFNDVAAPFTSRRAEAFALGLPFFFGRNVFIAIEGQNTPGGTGSYWAY